MPKSQSMANLTGRNAALGRAPGQRLLWVDYMGGADKVAELGLSKQDIKRQEVIYEIITTESDYVEDLDLVCEVRLTNLPFSYISDQCRRNNY